MKKGEGGKREREREIGLFPRSTGACILSFRSFFLPSLSFPVDPVAPDLPRRVVEVIKQEIPRHPRGKKKFSFSTTAIFTPSHSDLRNLGCLYGFEFFPISRRHWHESGRRKRNAMENTFWSSVYIIYLVIKIFVPLEIFKQLSRLKFRFQRTYYLHRNTTLFEHRSNKEKSFLGRRTKFLLRRTRGNLFIQLICFLSDRTLHSLV